MSVKQPRTLHGARRDEPAVSAWFDGESLLGDAWRVILKAAFALPMTKDEVAF
jgi:hypothetical protein